MQPVVFITAADARYFELVQGTVLSIREKPQGHTVAIAFLDLGCTPAQRAWLRQHVTTLLTPEWEFDFPQRSQVPTYLKGLLVRPFLRRYLPEAEVYCWLDADAWVQDWRAVELMIQGARSRGLAIVPEIDRGNQLLYGQLPAYWERCYQWYAQGFGEAIAQRFSTYPMLNAGVFALHHDAPHWEPWAKFLHQAAQHGPTLMTDQLALNLVIYASNLFERTELLPAWCNWTCHYGLPAWNVPSQRFVEPYLPHTPIGIVHLTVTKHQQVTVQTTDGATMTVNLRYPVRSPELLTLPAEGSNTLGKAQPDSIAAQLAEAMALGKAGKLAEAAALCNQVLQQQPEQAQAWHLLGLAALQQGQPEVALGHLQRAIALNSHLAEAHNHLGVAQSTLGHLDQGIACYQQAVTLQPDLVDAHFNLALALQKRGTEEDWPRAIAHYRQVLVRRPGYARAHLNLGKVLQRQGDSGAALTHYEQAIALQATAEAWYALGTLQQGWGELESAAQAYRQAIALNAQYVAAYNNLGTVLQELGQAQAAIAHYQTALELNPDLTSALLNLANLWLQREQFDEAEAAFRQILAREPEHVQAMDGLVKLLRQTCQWEDVTDWSERLMAIAQRQIEAGQPIDIMSLNTLLLPFTAAQQQAIAQHYAAALGHSLRSMPATLLPDWPRPRLESAQVHPVFVSPVVQAQPRRVRLGYLSGDFRDHPVAHLMRRLFELHDRQQFEVYAYSRGPDDGSSYRHQLQHDCDRFIDLWGMPPAAAAHQVRRDAIDLLIDLSGYTEHGFPQLLALRPAPIQINYLGYPATMGADFMDYIVVDPVLVPPEHQPHFTEQCVYLPHSYQINDNQQAIAPAPPRASVGLPETAMVYCCFNNTRKIDPGLFAVWMRVLAQVPDSVLWLFQSYAVVDANLRRAAAAHGVSGDRLLFAPRLPKADHLARLQCADLCLDTRFYNAHTTASDALWAGVPVLTLMGDTFASRVAASLLTAVGLPELITPTLADYERQALHLGHQPAARHRLKHQLRTTRLTSALYNTEQTVRHLETAYRQMWQQYQSERSPQPIYVAD